MRPKGKRHNTIAVELGGQSSAGDPSTNPPNTVRALRNYVIRPNRFDGRPPFVYDSLDTVSGFAIWQDLVNEVTHSVAVRSSDQKLYSKNSNGTGYGAGVSGLPSSTRLTSYTNLLGKLYMMFDNGSGVPSAAASWDGTNIVTAPFNSTVYSRTITAFVNRLFLINPRAQVSVQYISSSGFGSGVNYDFTNSTYWTLTNVTAQNVVVGGTTVCRLYPTSTTASKVEGAQNTGVPGNTGVITMGGVATPSYAVLRADLRCLDPSYAMPFKMQAYWNRSWGNPNLPRTLGDLISDGTNLQRCTTAGTSGGGLPAWATTVGATTADNTVTWTNEGTNVMGSLESTIPTATVAQDFTTFYVPVTVPPTHNSGAVNYRFQFGNTATPTIQLAPVDMSLRDGLTDGDVRKANRGFQVTNGDFYYPFFNQESSATATMNIDAVLYSEINNPKQIQAKNTYPLAEIAGLGTASIVANGRLAVWKRKGMWIFKGIADINEPILPETPAIPVGCLGPLAVDNARDGTSYWIGEQHVYKMLIGTDTFPQEIDSPGMFEEMFSRSASTWVESQSTYNMPLLAIDHANKDVWVYTQKGKIYVYSIEAKAWSYFDTNPTGTAAEVNGMIFDPVSNRMLVSFGGQSATRFDETSDAGDTIVTGGGTTWSITNDVVPRPFELFAPRYEASLLEIGLFCLATIENGSLTLSYSFDRGSTYTTPSGFPVSHWINDPRIRLPLAATGSSVTVKISRTGLGGSRNWSISKLDALLRVHRGELSRVNAT